MINTSDMKVLAEELRRVRTSIAPTADAYARALRAAHKRGVQPAVVLVVGELLCTSTTDASSAGAFATALDRFWQEYDSKLQATGS